MSKVHVKKNDKVVLLTGKDRGKSGKILQVIPKTGRVLVEGVNMQTKHKKPRAAGQPGGRLHQEGTVDSSNVMLLCPRCDKPTKIARKILANGEKARSCKKCNEVIDIVQKKD